MLLINYCKELLLLFKIMLNYLINQRTLNKLMKINIIKSSKLFIYLDYQFQFCATL